MPAEQSTAGQWNDGFDILVLNGPNLDQLARREPEHYGLGFMPATLEDVEKRLRYLGERDGVTLDFFQSNAEHLLIERICKHDYSGLIFNPAAFTHTSIALRDALLTQGFEGKRDIKGVSSRGPLSHRGRVHRTGPWLRGAFIEVHISNVYAREPFRHTSYFSDIAFGTIGGMGLYGYELAYMALRALKSVTSLEKCPVQGWPAEELHKWDSALLMQHFPENQD